MLIKIDCLNGFYFFFYVCCRLYIYNCYVKCICGVCNYGNCFDYYKYKN